MPSSASDRNLLYGILALQVNFLGRDALICGMNAWVLQKHRPLGDILVEQGALRADLHEMLQAMVDKHLEVHGHDAQQSLVALRSSAIAANALEEVADPEVQASLAVLATPQAPDVSTAGPAATLPLARPPVPTGVRFQPLRFHARGGLGKVYVARDSELKREVALKEIQDRYADDADCRARFLLEAEVTGNLEHPGIVPVYGLGCYPDGRPYYAMRFIQGDSLKEAIDRFHQADGAGGDAGVRALELRQLLGRFVAVCNAVAYAHSRGVLHRDLKPANVMLGKYGETLVVDWGLAKPLARHAEAASEGYLRPDPAGGSLATRAGSFVGTPAFASPEQAAGRLDQLGPASDVYSLGAILYCLLTGEVPFADLEGAVLERVQRGQLRPPRQIKGNVPPALEAVCLEAMALEPGNRYATARALAEDVERWLADEPVLAYPEPRLARLARWARRHRSAVLSAAAALVVLALSLGVLAAVLTRHNRALEAANAREREAKQRESQAREKAQANFRLAREAVKEYCVKVSLDPRLRQADFSELRKELLQTAARFHEKFKEQEGDDPGVRAERAYAWFELAFIAKRTGSAAEALGHYERSLALWEPLVREHPDNRDYRWALAACCNDMAGDYALVGRAAQAEQAYRKALGLHQELAAAHPGDQKPQSDLAFTHSNFAYWLFGRNRTREAEEHYEKALTIRQALLDANRENEDLLRDLADTRHKLGFLYFHTNREAQAGKAYQQALAIRQRLYRDHPRNVRSQGDLAWSYLNLGDWYRDAGQPDKAEEALRQSVKLFGDLAEEHPSVPDHFSNLSGALQTLGLFCQAQGRTQEAGAAYRRALEVQEKLAKRYPAHIGYAVDLGGSYCNMGRRSRQNGAPRDSLEWFDRAQATLEAVRRRDPGHARARLYLRNTHWNRADTMIELDRPADALREWDKARELDPTDTDRTYSHMSRALCLSLLGKHEEAVSLAGELLGRPPADSRYTLFRAAQVFSRASAALQKEPAQRPKLAEQYAARAVSLLRRARSLGHFHDPIDVATLQKAEAFTALRQRADFLGLLKELAKKPGS